MSPGSSPQPHPPVARSAPHAEPQAQAPSVWAWLWQYRLHPIGPVLGGLVLHPLAQAQDVLRFYRDFSRAIPDELNTFGLLTT